MVLNQERKQVELVYAGQEIDVTEFSSGFYNERQKVQMSLEKMLEVNEVFGIGNNSELANVTFDLYAAEDITAVDGAVIPADGLIEVVSIDAAGGGVVKTDLPFGSYYLKETASTPTTF